MWGEFFVMISGEKGGCWCALAMECTALGMAADIRRNMSALI